MQLFLISNPNVLWDELLRNSSQVLGRSLTSSLDNRRVGLNRRPPGFLSLLKEMVAPGTNPLDAAGHLLEHMSFTFGLLATRTTTFDISINTRLALSSVQSKTPDVYFSVLSGTLLQWQTAIQNCCLLSVSSEVRAFGTEMLNYFEANGYKTYMASMGKVVMGDGTVRLITNQPG